MRSSMLRPLKRQPLTTSLVVGVLALGLGTTLAVFAVAEAVLVRALPVEDPGSLLYVASKRLDSGGLFPSRLHQALTWQEAPSLESLTVMKRGTVHLRTGELTERLDSTAVTANYFATTGARPAIGRVFSQDDDGPEALISHELWQRHFEAGDSVLGQMIELDGVALTVVGVMPESQPHSLLGWQDVWTHLEPDVDIAEAGGRDLWGYSVIARLRHDASLEAARADLETVSLRLANDRPESYEGWGADARPVREFMAADLEEPMQLVQGAAMLVLLIACLTAGSLLFAMTANRRQEMALRRALGAGGGRLFRQLLGESAVITATAAALGLLLAFVAGRTLLSKLPPDLLELESLSFGAGAVSLTIAAGLVTIFICAGLAAIAIHRAGTERAFRREGREGDRLRAGLVAAQTTLATLAITGTLLLLVSLRNVTAVAPGFDAEGLLTLRLEMPRASQADKDERRAALENLVSEVEALPGVRSAAMAGFGLPLTGSAAVFQIWIEGQERGPQPDEIVHAQVISPGFFDTLGIEWLAGRHFEVGETWESHRSVIVNETFAQRYFPRTGASQQEKSEAVLGRWVEFGNGERGTVVGLVGDTRQLALDQDTQAEIYLAWGLVPLTQSLLVRTAGESWSVAETVRRTIHEALPGTPIFDARSGEQIVRASYQTRAVTAWTLTAFAGLALLLGLAGVYGLVLHQVTSRRRDLGVRVAVGATSNDLVRWAIGRGLGPAALGLAAGLLMSLAAGRFFESQLYGVESGDPSVLAFAGVTTFGSALLSALIPARSAGRVDPASALRAD